MNLTTRSLTSAYLPLAALVVHGKAREYCGMDYQLELRMIGSDGLMGAGKPVTHDFMNKIASSFSESFANTPYGPTPQNLLFADTRAGCEKYVWYVRPGRHMMYFDDSLGVADGPYHTPGLIFMAKNNALYVFAFMGKKPASDCELYHAPFFNIYSDGKICLGNGVREVPAELTFTHLIASWEKVFWCTKFTHLLGNSPTRTNLVSVLENSLNSFDPQQLVPMKGLTLKKLYQ